MKWGGFALAALAVAIALAVFASPFASSSPDGLERVAQDKGFLDKATESTWAPVPGYEMPGVTRPGLRTALAGLAGTLATFGTAWFVAKAATRRGGEKTPERRP